MSAMFHPWSRLPFELKLQIISYSVADRYAQRDKRNIKHLKNALIPLIRVGNEELARLAKEAFYTTNVFIVATTAIKRGYSFPQLTYPPRIFGKWVRHLEIRLNLYLLNSAEQTFFLGHNELSWLVMPKLRLDSSVLRPSCIDFEEAQSRVNWQDHFPHIQNLKFDICILAAQPSRYDLHHNAPLSCFGTRVKDLAEFLQTCEIPINAKKVEIVVSCEGCRKNGTYNDRRTGCEPMVVRLMNRAKCTCEKDLGNTLKTLMQQRSVPSPTD